MKLGDILDRMRRQYAVLVWKIGLFVFLVIAVLANFYVRPHEAEYRLDAYPGFWALFGLVTAVGMVWIMKRIIQPVIKRPEEGDDD